MAYLKQLTAYGSIVSGKIRLYHEEEFRKNIKLFEDCEIVLEVVKKTRTKSTKQLGYYYAAVIPIIQKAVYEVYQETVTAEEVHDLMKKKFNALEIVNAQTGEIEVFGRSTKKLQTWQFEEFLEKVRRWAKEFLEVDIPLPNEQSELLIGNSERKRMSA